MLARNSANANLATNLKTYVTDSFFQPLVLEQLKAIGVTLVLAIVGTTVIAYIVKVAIGLRPTEEEETHRPGPCPITAKKVTRPDQSAAPIEKMWPSKARTYSSPSMSSAKLEDVFWLVQKSAVVGDLAVLVAQAKNRPERVIGVKIDTLQRRIFRAAIDVAANDTSAKGVFGKLGILQHLRLVRIFNDRVNVLRAIGAGFEMMKAFAGVPAIISSFDNQINFLPQVLPHVTRPQIAGFTIKTVPPRIAHAPGLNFMARA